MIRGCSAPCGVQTLVSCIAIISMLQLAYFYWPAQSLKLNVTLWINGGEKKLIKGGEKYFLSQF